MAICQDQSCRLNISELERLTVCHTLHRGTEIIFGSRKKFFGALTSLGLACAQFAYAEDCDKSVISRDSLQAEFNITLDKNHYSRRSLSAEKFCGVITTVKRVFPEYNHIPIAYVGDWDSPEQNAKADYDRAAGVYTLTVYGGILNRKGFNEEALAAITCHELGHVMGGTKKTRLARDGKMPINYSEGFADYFAAQVCLKSFYSSKNPSEPRSKRIQIICESSTNIDLCISVLNAGFDEMMLNATDHINLDLSDPSVADHTSKTPQNHPRPECRFDTMIAGFFCSELNEYPCGFSRTGIYNGRGDPKALPPRCFFRP